jgi:hypothetical protein
MFSFGACGGGNREKLSATTVFLTRELPAPTHGSLCKRCQKFWEQKFGKATFVAGA